MKIFSLLLIIVLSLGFLTICKAQLPKTKKITKINFTYYSGNYVIIDTTITQYNFDGSNINDGRFFGPFINILNTKTIDSTKNKIHRQILFSDSTIHNVLQSNYKDSFLVYTIEKNDTIGKVINYLKRKKVIRTVRWNYRKFSTLYFSDVKTINNNFIFKKKLETIKHYKNGVTETKKITLNKIHKTEKIFSFNVENNEWFLEQKLKFNSKNKIKKSVDQFYHDYHKRYFKTRTKFKYNKFGQVTSEVTYDHYFVIENKKCYFYEYY